MRKIFLIGILFFFIAYTGFSQTTGADIYDQRIPLQLKDSSISLERFRGKTILLVNVSAKDSLNQFVELQRLYERCKTGGLVMILFPSNSFGREPGGETGARNSYSTRMDSSFIITSPVEVTGPGIHSLFKWLSAKQLNGVMNGQVKNDWSKFLVNKKGKLVGYFSDEVAPMSEVLLKAIGDN